MATYKYSLRKLSIGNHFQLLLLLPLLFPICCARLCMRMCIFFTLYFVWNACVCVCAVLCSWQLGVVVVHICRILMLSFTFLPFAIVRRLYRTRCTYTVIATDTGFRCCNKNNITSLSLSVSFCPSFSPLAFFVNYNNLLFCCLIYYSKKKKKLFNENYFCWLGFSVISAFCSVLLCHSCVLRLFGCRNVFHKYIEC